jgi:release factor glutamine methyltransferase
VATDKSEAALAVARRNAVRIRLMAGLSLLQTNWAAGCVGPFDLIVSNPPYIPAADIAGLDADVREHDPLLALSGGEDGLDAYRALLPQAAGLVSPHGRVAVEFGAGQHDGVAAIASRRRAANGRKGMRAVQGPVRTHQMCNVCAFIMFLITARICLE